MVKLHFHADSDGIVSAFFVSKELDRLDIPHSLHPSLGAQVDMKGEQNISLDISSVTAKQKWNLSIDHHVSDRPGIIYTNPRNSGFEWPVSFTTYAMFGDASEAWIAAVSVVADWGAEKVPARFWDVVKEQWPELVPEVNQKKLVCGKLGEMALMIDSSVSMNRASGAVYALNALKDAGDWKGFIGGEGKAGKLKELKTKIMGEVQSVLGTETVLDKCVVLRFQSPHRIKSLVAAMAKEKYPEKMIIIAQDEGNKVRLSFRNGNNLDKLVKKLTEGIGSGGGHPQASGGWVQLDKWDQFYERLSRNG